MTARERAFAVAYLGAARGVAKTAAIMAGYSRATAEQAGSRLLRNVKVRALLEKTLAKRDAKTIADAEERDRILSSIARDNQAGDGERIRAIVELNRCSGRHSVTLHHKGRSLEDILGESRQPDKPAAVN